MSIKQNGGVFGRNPTFNDVTIEGQLTFDGDIDINSDLKVDGNLDVTGNLTLPDNSKAKFGTGSGDLEIYHDGNNSYIKDVGTGSLILDGATYVDIRDPNGFKTFRGVSGGGAFLYHVNAQKLKTTSTGISVTGDVIIATSGSGIDFSATAGTGTSELLDDYEEGTFTPVAAFTGGSGTITYGTQDGSYTKVGNLVTIRIFLVTASLASRTGNMTITGLPFTSAATYHGVAACGYAAGLAITAGQYLTGYIPPSDAKIQITRFSSSAGTSLVTTTQWSDNGGAMFTAQYTV